MHSFQMPLLLNHNKSLKNHTLFLPLGVTHIKWIFWHWAYKSKYLKDRFRDLKKYAGPNKNVLFKWRENGLKLIYTK